MVIGRLLGAVKIDRLTAGRWFKVGTEQGRSDPAANRGRRGDQRDNERSRECGPDTDTDTEVM
jgi:hypothetical protein